MKGIITLAFTHFIILGMAQTPMIAHKSHSGTSDGFFIDPSSNFGAIRMDFEHQNEPPKPYISEVFKPLNDSVMILEISDHEQKIIQTDTLPNKKKYSTTLFQYFYQDSIRKEELLKIHQNELKQEEEQKKQLELRQQQINDPATSKKKEKKSYLLFLFGITGSGMLLIKLFRSAKSQQSIA